VYEASNRPVGFVILTRGEAGDAERIFLIAVAPEARGRGVGKALINTAVRHCRRKGMPLLRVGTQSSNKAAVARYESCEFSLERTYCELSWWLNEHS
jgi:ribosomal protein S18 acetylase RimI-like enzyme